MAIALRGTATGTTPGSVNTENLSITLPGGTAQYDVVYAATTNVTSSNIDVQVSTSGYTELADLFSSDSNPSNFGVFRKVQGASPDSTVTFADPNTSSAAPYAGLVMVLSGVNIATPEDATPTTATGTNGNAPDPPSITTVTPNAWALAVGGASTDNPQTPSVQSGYSDLVTSVTNSGSFNDSHVMMSRKLVASAGAENPDAFGMTGTTANDSWCAATIAVRPAKVLDAGAGSYALTGTAATPKRGLRVAAGVGSYSLSGQAAALKLGRRVAAASGSYALTGQAAAFVRGYRVVAGAGSYDLSGQAASLFHGWKVNAEAGSYTLNGQDAALILASDTSKVIVADAGSYSLTGATAGLLHAWRIAAGAGSYALGGQAASLLQARKTAAGVGSYNLTGAAAQLLQGRRVTASVGSYSLNGEPAAFVRTRRLEAATGSYALIGTNATLDLEKLFVDHGLGRGRVTSTSASGRVRASAASGRPSVSKPSGRITVH